MVDRRDAPDLNEMLDVVITRFAAVLAEQLIERLAEKPVDCPAASSKRPERSAAPTMRRAPRMPPIVNPTVRVSDENRERARQALLRRGYDVKEGST